jgi:hypothetical protein
MSPLGWLGVALQVGGLVLAGLGLADAWRNFGPGEPFLAPVRRSLALAGGWLARLARRVLRRGNVVVIVGAGELKLSGSLEGRGRIGFGPLPKHDVTAAIAILEQRTRELREAIASVDERTSGRLDASDAKAESVERRLAGEVSRLDLADRRIASGGVRLAAIGLGATAAGMILQAFAT